MVAILFVLFKVKFNLIFFLIIKIVKYFHWNDFLENLMSDIDS